MALYLDEGWGGRILSDIARFQSTPDNHRRRCTEELKREHAHGLQAVLHILLRGNPQYEEMQKQLAQKSVPLALGNILEKIEASPDLPEALQPKGFARGIKLHRYQRQTLQWMCDAENTRLRDKLWICLNREVHSVVDMHDSSAM